MLRFPSAVLLTAVVAAPAAAQDAPPPLSFGSEAEVVVVDVVATDGKGRPVPGLSREDFVVYEDGKPQSLTLFEAIQQETVLAGAPAAPAAPVPVEPAPAPVSAPARGVLVMVFDEYHLSALAMEKVRSRLLEACRANAASGPDVVLVSTGGGGAWHTRLPEGLDDVSVALERFRGLRPPQRIGSMSDYEAFLITVRQDQQVLTQVYRRYLDQGLGVDATMSPDKGEAGAMRGQRSEFQQELPAQGLGMVRAEAEARWRQVRSLQTATLKSLTRLLTGLSEKRGRKAVLLVSEGFVHDPAVLEHRELVEAARAARAVIHVIDPRDSNTLFTHDADRDDPVDSRDLTDTLARTGKEAEGSEALAHATGGRVVRNLPNLTDALTRIGSELRTYYLLGYAPAARPLDGKFRKLKVEAKREGVHLEARPGYYAVAPFAQRRAREAAGPALQAALDSAVEATGVPVHLASYVLGQGAKGTVVRLVGEVETAGLAAPGAVDAAFQLVSRGRGQVLQAVLPGASGTGSRLRLETQFEAPPGAYQARLVVREKGGEKRMGSAREVVEVLPDQAFRLSTPICTDVVSGEVPVARGDLRFPKDATLHCMVEVLGAPANASVVAGLKLQAPDGKVHVDIEPAPFLSARLTRQWTIPLSGLSPGSYELVISVDDTASRQGLRRRERFEVAAN